MHDHTDPTLFSRTLWALVGIFLLGALSRILLTEERLTYRRVAGEILLALLGAVIMYTFGLMQEMPVSQMLFYGSFASLGTLRLLQLLIKVVQGLMGKVQ